MKFLRFGKGTFQLTLIRVVAESIYTINVKFSAQISESAAERPDSKIAAAETTFQRLGENSLKSAVG